MKQRINFKTIYLIATITVGLLGLAIGSTYAIFTTSAEINNPISLSTTLTSDDDVFDVIDIVIEPYDTITKTINVVSDNGVDKIVNVINIKDLLSDDNGNYNGTYYDVRNELNISDNDMDILMNSSYLNDSLKIVLDNVVSYKLRGGTKLSNDDIYNMIVNDVNNDDSINNILKNKVIDKSDVYRNDISDYIYDLDVNLISDL